MSKGGGLAGVVAGDSEIATVGLGSGLNYRGYNIEDLAKHSSFEEVFYLLLFKRMPLEEELRVFKGKIAKQRFLPHYLKKALEIIPSDAHPMDVMRCVSSMLGTLEPEEDPSANPQLGKRGAIDIAIRLVALFGPALLYWHHFHKNGLRIKTYTGPEDSVALNFVKLMSQ